MYKLVALDIDGTTYGTDHKISKKVHDTIQEARKKGVKFSLISGRGPNDIEGISRELDLEPNTLIGCLNGSIVKTVESEEFILNKTLTKEDVKNCIKLTDEMNFAAFVYIGNNVYVKSNKDEFVILQNKFTYEDTKEVGNLTKFLEENNLLDKVNKIGIANEYDELLKFKDRFIDENKNNGQLLFSLPFYLELIHEGTSKGNALKYISDSLNIERKEIISMGDGENDIDMLKCAGLGIAMGNAFSNVKECADFVTLTNKEDGVAYAIEKFILKNKK